MQTKLETWMELVGIDDREMAEKTGLDKSYICLLRTGKRPVSAAFRWHFARAYGFDMAVTVLGEAPAKNGRIVQREPVR